MADRQKQDSALAFTLVELLVVVAIIAVLIGLLTPALSRAKDAAMAAKCMAQLRQNATAMLAYVQDNRGRLPRALGSDITADGTNPGNSYAWFTRLVGRDYLAAEPQSPPLDSSAHDLPDAVTSGSTTLVCPAASPGVRWPWGWPADFGIDNDFFTRSWRETDTTGYPGKPAQLTLDTSYLVNASQGDWTGISSGSGNPFLAQWSTAHRLGITRSISNMRRAADLMMMADGFGFKFGVSTAYMNPKHGQTAEDGAQQQVNMAFFDGHVEAVDPRDTFDTFNLWAPSRQSRSTSPVFRIQD